jgi:GntR family transcriptional regulator, transcriptional repressor for pyruvate dehydrogenase complex
MEKLRFEPLLMERASAHIEKTVREAILSGTLKVGDRLPTEKEMASQFGVSLVTLREALRALETSGLIKKKKGNGRGIFVSEVEIESIKASLMDFMNFKDLSSQHLYEVRKIIEPSAIKLVVQNITPEEIQKLEENVSYCEKKLNGGETFIDEKEFFDLDKRNNEFHRLIAAGTHNPILSLTLDYIFDFIRICETTFLVSDVKYCMDNVRDHRIILEYLKQKDSEKSEQQMILHLKRLDEYLMEIRKRPPISGDSGGTEFMREKGENRNVI